MIRNIHQLFVYSAVIVFVIFVIQLYSFVTKFSEDEQEAVQLVQQQMHQAESKFNNRLAELMTVTENLAEKITEQQLDSLGIMQVLEKTMTSNPDVFGFGVGFEPYAFSGTRRLFGPFYIRPGGEVQLQFIEDSYDYSTRTWYTKPLHEGAAWFEPPYYGQVAQTMMAEYSVPFYRVNNQGQKEAIGIVFLDYSLEDITRSMSAIDLGKSGYGLILSEEGTMIAHPKRENVLAQKTIVDFVDEWQDAEIKKLFDSLTVGGQPYVQAINKKTGIASRIFFTEIDESGWRLGAVFIEDAFKTDSNYINQVIILMTACVVGMFMLMFLFYLYRLDFKGRAMKRLVPMMVIVFLIAISGIWLSKIYQSYNIFQQEDSFPVVESTSLRKFLGDQDSLRAYYHEKEIVRIPTGVFVKHIEFDGSHNVRLSGVIWQRYPAMADSLGIAPGLFFLSTAPDAEAQDFSEIYRMTEYGETKVGWHFRVEVREFMQYGLYPIDRERVTLSLSHPDMSKNIQLTPDLSGYDNIIPSRLPGIDQQIILPEWDTEKSYFAFEKHDYNSNLGIMSPVDSDYKYDLGFNVILKRKFLWPTMANIIPLVTITILLFLALISTSRKTEERKGIAFSGFGLLELCAAFLFVAILTHIDLRSNLVINYIMYMDYFYFHVYFTIIVCSLAAVLLNREQDQRKMEVVRLLYWPLLLGSLFIFTALRFY
ncbi:MAG: cache domain-containing protein [Marinoscillum sp.]